MALLLRKFAVEKEPDWGDIITKNFSDYEKDNLPTLGSAWF